MVTNKSKISFFRDSCTLCLCLIYWFVCHLILPKFNQTHNAVLDVFIQVRNICFTDRWHLVLLDILFLLMQVKLGTFLTIHRCAFWLLFNLVTGKFACNNSLLNRKQTCWNILKPETARTNAKKITANQHQSSSQQTWLKTAILGRLPQATLVTTSLKRQQSHKTSHKTQAKITRCLVTIRWNPKHRDLPEGSGSFKAVNHQTITQAIANWNTWRKWEFPSHMTIYGYK